MGGRGHPRSAVMCPPKLVGTPGQTIKIARGGQSTSGSGPSGWKLRPSKVLSTSLAKLAADHRARKK